METNPVTRAIEAAGGVSKMAAKMHITYQAIRKWERAGRPPAERVLQIERLTDGRVTRHELRPDLYPHDEAAA